LSRGVPRDVPLAEGAHALDSSATLACASANSSSEAWLKVYQSAME
jgi:hypothetical protein